MATVQADAIAFLADPASHGGGAVVRIDTHISHVFLTGERAYKLKRSVQLPFLDFTALATREAACRREVEVNSLASPDLYLGVRPLVRKPAGAIALGGAGEVIDWVVEMRRFDQDGLFDRLVDVEGGLDRARLHDLAERIFAFHRAAPQHRDRGGVAGLRWTIETNLATMRGLSPGLLDGASVEALAGASLALLDRHAPLLEARRAAGRVRRCHGDLHLGNICLVHGHPALFDAIEFSEPVACVDVLYDLAFLLMDLDHRGRRREASWVLNHYLDLSADHDGLPAMPLFLSLRAAIRAHVKATMAMGAGGAGAERMADEARGYLAAASAYLDPPVARLLAVGGLSGSGKSRMARELSPFLGVPGAVVVRSDTLRKHLMGVSIHDRLGPEGYTPEVTAQTYEALFDLCRRLLAAGVPVVADAVFARPDQRAAIGRIAREAGAPFDGLWLEAPPELAARRIQERKANVSDATPEILRHQLGYELGVIDWARIDSAPPKDVSLAAARAVLGV